MARRYKLTDLDMQIMQAASRLESGGVAAFTAHYFSPINGIPRWDLVWRDYDAAHADGMFSEAWDNRIPPNEWDLDYEAGEYVPWIPLNWQAMIAHDSRMDATIIAGFGSGKTVGLGMAMVYWACMTPNFKGMNVAPVGWQAEQMFEAIRKELADYDNRHERPTYISQLVTKMVTRPFPKIHFFNGSTIEFKSAKEQGKDILSWSGDVAVIDEAGKLETVAHTNLDDLLVNLGSRMRGVVSGRTRMGKLIVMSTADYCPELWERYDAAEEMPEEYFSMMLTSYDNPFFTEKQLKAVTRRIKDPDLREQLMMSRRPTPRGKEFTPQLLDLCRCRDLDEMMEHSRSQNLPGYELVRDVRGRIVKWVMPASPFERYVLVGDPGQATPPVRNSPVVLTLKVTGFPHVPAELAAFHWVDGQGSYWPFINQMDEWYHVYQPVYSSFDATGTQKGFDELYFSQHGMLMEGMNVQGQKMRMVLALKLIMGKGLLLMPSGIQGIWMQLGGWQMPDTKLRQDIASALFMAGDLLNRLFIFNKGDEDEEDEEVYELPALERRRAHRAGNPRVLRQNRGRSR